MSAIAPFIVAIDDDRDFVAFLVALLSRNGYRCAGFSRACEALDYIRRNRVAAVITDIIMPDVDGIEVLHTIRGHCPDIKVIAVSGDSGRGHLFYLGAMLKLGAAAVLTKPIDPPVLVAAVENCLRARPSRGNVDSRLLGEPGDASAPRGENGASA